MAQFIKATESEEVKTPVEAFAQKIAQSYMDQQEADRNFRQNFARDNDNYRTA